jgi:NitT/TauT family transport system substrate-binding protein
MVALKLLLFGEGEMRLRALTAIRGALLTFVALVAASCAHAQGKGETVRIQTYGPGTNMLFDVAIAKGYCENHGIHCELQTVANGALGAQAVISRDIDAGFFPVEILINASLKAGNLKAILSGATRDPYEIIITNELDGQIVGKEYPAFMKFLVGKKIGVPVRGTAAEFQFKMLAAKAGVDPDGFTFVAVGLVGSSYGALLSKQIDASMSYGPSSALCDVLRSCKTLFILGDANEPSELAATKGASSNIVVRQDFIDNSPNVVEAMIGAAQDAEAFVQNPANFDALLTIAQADSQVVIPHGKEIAISAIKRYLPGFRASINRKAVQQIADNMLAMKQLDAPFDTSRVIYERAP